MIIGDSSPSALKVALAGLTAGSNDKNKQQVGDVGPFVTFLEYEQYLRVQFRTDADDECCGPIWMNNLMDSWNLPLQDA